MKLNVTEIDITLLVCGEQKVIRKTLNELIENYCNILPYDNNVEIVSAEVVDLSDLKDKWLLNYMIL